METAAVLDLLKTHGLSLVAGLSLIEGPIVTVISAYLATLGIFRFATLIPVLIVADLLGDIVFYCLGRYGASLIPARLKPDDTALQDRFQRQGGRILAMGKLTHAAGAAVLVSAGIARMQVPAFLFYNTLATIPKTLFFAALGILFGHAHEAISRWIGHTSLALLALILAAGGIWFWKTRR